MILLIVYLLIAAGMGVWLEELEDVPDIPTWAILLMAFCWPLIFGAMAALMLVDGVRLLFGAKR